MLVVGHTAIWNFVFKVTRLSLMFGGALDIIQGYLVRLLAAAALRRLA
jgi:hypothetical protein